MKSIEVEDDIYEFLLRNTKEIGEDASSILRRLLNMSVEEVSLDGETDIPPQAGTQEIPETRPQHGQQVEPAVITDRGGGYNSSDARVFLQSNGFRACESVTDRYLEALRWIHHCHQQDFHRISNIRGAQRVYFSQSENEIVNSGNATQPRKIDGTRWYAMTNNDSANKREILKQVMCLFHYPAEDVDRVTSAIIAGAGGGAGLQI